MTLNVVGGQGVVSGTLTVASNGQTGEIIVFTALSTPDYTAVVTLSLVATRTETSSYISGGFALPGSGGGAATDSSSSFPVAGGGVAVGRLANNYCAWGATSTFKVGPGVSVRVPWAFSGGSTTISYIINYHVAYVRNP